jgi:adenine-specific DNA-methyltransferase
MALNKNIFNFLIKHNTDTFFINSLIVSNFLISNKIETVNNKLINKLYKENKIEDSSILNEFITIQEIKTFEDLIEAFEFVISPADKIVNGAVYTPKFIREYIVENSIQKSVKDLNDIITGDISCGCGGFLLTIAEYLKRNTNKTYKSIYAENIFGIDIEKYSIERTEILLTLFAISHGEDEKVFKYNLVVGNSLKYDWRNKNRNIKKSNGFDIIVGNPPYVCSRNMDNETLALLKNIEVSNSGHPDLYIPFFQIGMENLNSHGVLGYITVNTFLKSVNGRALRDYFSRSNANLMIINFGGEQLFKDRNTYTCLCFISFGNPLIRYMRIPSVKIGELNLDNLKTFNYEDLNHLDGWNLVNDIETSQFIESVESVGKPFGKLYETRNGIATLKNEVYKFRPVREDRNFFYLKKDDVEYPIEKTICRDIVNANKIKSKNDIPRLIEKIIFPYDIDLKIINESTLIKKFPNTYNYFLEMKDVLATRDKGQGKYEEWFAFGRRQSMDINRYKLFFAHISKRPKFVLCDDKDLLFYNGISIISESIDDLLVIKKILESDIFYKYISHTTKDYSSGYISLSRNYIKNFGIVNLNKEQIDFILSTKNIENYLRDLYGLNVEGKIIQST